MPKLLSSFLISAVLISFFSCSNEEYSVSISQSSSPELFSEEAIQQDIVALLSDSSKSGFLNNKEVAEWYHSHQYQPRWFQNNEDIGNIFSLYSHLKLSFEHGINSEYFKTKEIGILCKEVYQSMVNNQLSYNKLALLDIMFSDAAVTYSNALQYGIVNPKELYGESYKVASKIKKEELDILENNDTRKYLYAIQPKALHYKFMQQAYLDLLDNEEEEQLNFPKLSGKIEYGDTSRYLTIINKRLFQLGYLTKEDKDIVYDSTLFKAIYQFQTDNGLIADGVIGNYTYELITLTNEQKKQMLVASMERMRWINVPEENPYLLVNIPSFKLQVREGETVFLEMKTCTGSKATSYSNHETPLMQDTLEYMVFNPTWSVPRSIAEKEMYRKIVKDPTYLERNGYKVMKNGKFISSSEMNMANYTASSMPYKFVQKPGRGNALGTVKFIFPNESNIYLHDTPSQSAFKNDNRAVSHGCVRIEKPKDLAKYLMQYSELNEEEKEEIGSSGKKTIRVNLKEPIPVYILYFTAFADLSGQIKYYKDVYEKDAALLDAMK